MKEKTKTYWLCEQHINMVPMGEYLSDMPSRKTVSHKLLAKQFPDKQTCSNQCPPGFFPTEHHDPT